ncbi:hypothetical protein CJI97_005209 [Candidozyma auris]|nr:hypothetical protein CJI97_005209 [[Candida] auris]
MFHRTLARDTARMLRPLTPALRAHVSPAFTSFRPISVSSRVPTRTTVSSVLKNHRLYSVLSQSPAKVYKYDDMKKLVEKPDPSTVILDVREPVEFQEGHIPGAHNVPFKSSPGALDLSEEDFEDAFGFKKPSKDSELVFYCLGGVRSTAAEELAHSFGYNKRANYIGSWEDWVAHENQRK